MIHSLSQKLLIIGLTISCGLALDQTSKRIAEQKLIHNTYSFLFDTIRLQFIKNAGAFLGFGSNFPTWIKIVLFLALPLLFLVGALLFVIFSRRLARAQLILISLMISGGIGNLIDRFVLNGLVTDFLNMGIGPIRTGIFNLADVAIMAGSIGLVTLEIVKSKRAKNAST
jgi:signal peptidase II